MEKLTESQRESVKKMTTVRLSHKLISAGMTEDEVEKLDRQGLMHGLKWWQLGKINLL
jgi:hypothetical protein